MIEFAGLICDCWDEQDYVSFSILGGVVLLLVAFAIGLWRSR